MIANLEEMLLRADAVDRAEGQLAYARYHGLMKSIASRYSSSIQRVTAAFVALSPNNDYFGNLRSLISLLEGIRLGVPVQKIVSSTYGHCKLRAHSYLIGQSDFLLTVKGKKITNFYHNIINPNDNRFVTIDGHMVATWRGRPDATMKDSICRGREYQEISDAIKQLAFRNFLIPNQVQATIWFARKRTLNVKYDPQLRLFGARNDLWHTERDLSELKPFAVKGVCGSAPLNHLFGEPWSER